MLAHFNQELNETALEAVSKDCPGGSLKAKDHLIFKRDQRVLKLQEENHRLGDQDEMKMMLTEFWQESKSSGRRPSPKLAFFCMP